MTDTIEAAQIPPDAASASDVADEAAPRPYGRAAELALLSPTRAAFTLAWPGILEQLVRAMGQTVVFAFIGHLGAPSIAAVGAAFQFTFLLFPVFQALSIGTVALVSRRVGEGRLDEAGRVIRQSLLLGTALGIVSGIGFAVFADPLLRLLGADAEVASLGAPYLAIVGGLNVFMTLSIIGMAAIRAGGDTRTPMIFSILFSLLNVPLTYVLMNVAGLGIIGAAIAVCVMNALFVVATFIVLWRGRAGLTIAGGHWGISRERLGALLAISVPSAIESLLFSVGLLALSGLVFKLGTQAYAAHQLVAQLETISFLPCIGFGIAASTLVGQSLGMKRPDRAVMAGWAAMRMAVLWTFVIGAVFVVFAAPILGLYTSDQGVITAGIGATIIVGIAQPAQAVIFTIGGALRGAGDTRFTLAATCVNWFVVRLPLAVLLGLVLGLGLAGIWLAVLVDYVARAVMFSLRFRGGRWQTLVH